MKKAEPVRHSYPKYCSLVSRGKVWIKVCIVQSAQKIKGAVSPACFAIALATADPTAAIGYAFSLSTCTPSGAAHCWEAAYP
jgi:hypothetical protein